jgi:acyl-phosphate glycerol 3-phosphate acyltransferase
MTAPLTLAAVCLAAYLVGAVPFGYLAARARGVDILRAGSGNIGATNVGRVLGRRWGIAVFLLDAAKGAVPVLLAGLLPQPPELPPASLPVAAGVAAFLGHLFPVYLGFRGGKGVATGAGIIAVLVPATAALALLTWAAVLAATRYVSLASVVAAAAVCGLRLGFTAGPWDEANVVVTAFCLSGAALVVVRHHGNLRRLLRGSENRFPESPAMLQLGRTLHVLALGLWFGAAVFFTLTGALLFPTFADVSRADAADRPAWLPLPKLYDHDWPGNGFTGSPRLEQGSRLTGAAVAPLFPWYFGIQGACAVLTSLTALAWVRRGGVHRVRAVVLVLALGSVPAGWWLEQKVEALRGPRNTLTDDVLRAADPTPAQVEAALQARADFGRWHGYSLALNFVTLALVAAAMALAGSLPERPLATQPPLAI